MVTRRVLAAAVLGGVVIGGSGAASAAPPDGPAGYQSLGDYARSILTGPDGLTVHVNVTAYDGAAPTADLAVFVDGYTCLTSDPLALTLVPLESATVEGSVDLACTAWDDPETPEDEGGPDLYGTADVELSWLGTGKKIREVFTGNRMHCVGKIFERQVVLSGDVTVVVPDLYEGATDDALGYTDTALRHEEVVCPPALA